MLCYFALGAYAFWLYAFGPALALLQAQLHLSYAMVGAYSALWAGGATAVGLSFAWAGRRLGRRALLWWAALAATAGAALFTTTRAVALSMAGAAILGFAGTTVQTLTQAVLSDRHGARRDQALVESNIGAGVAAVAAPVALGLLGASPAGWRSAMALPALGLAGLYLTFRRQPLPAPPSSPTNDVRRTRLPLACWLLALLVAIGMAVEFCVVYFGAEVLIISGLAPASAATAMSTFYVGILAGRIAGGRLTRRLDRTVRLLWWSLAVTTIGFLAFWQSGQPVLAVAGLFICGLGVANLFPLSLALTLAAAPEHTDAANARTQLLGGLLVITAPLVLGKLADTVGLTAAFTVEPILIAMSALLLLAGLRSSRPSARGMDIATYHG